MHYVNLLFTYLLTYLFTDTDRHNHFNCLFPVFACFHQCFPKGFQKPSYIDSAIFLQVKCRSVPKQWSWTQLPVSNVVKAVSTFVESKADVSMKDTPFCSVHKITDRNPITTKAILVLIDIFHSHRIRLKSAVTGKVRVMISISWHIWY